MHKVGIIGYGFVGKAVASQYLLDAEHIIDPNSDFAKGNYESIKNTDGVFVCVPSPQREDGSCDTSILDEVLQNLYAINYKGVIISKVTAPPSYYKNAQKIFDNLVYVPEFLTAANAVADYQNTTRHFIGGTNAAYVLLAKSIIGGVGEFSTFVDCSIEEASMLKYIVNSFLATKVVFMNEIKELCDKTNIDYTKVSKMLAVEHRVGRSHNKVPGPDGQLGFGGACFPKDTNALLTYAKDNDIMLSVLNTAVTKNNTYR
jgi:UDPglucose 6-dehydrogenase